MAFQLFVPPVTGLSDNNDFSKVLGPAHVCYAGRDKLNTWFVSSYEAGPRCDWQSGFTSSEIWLVKIARFLGRPFTGRYRFDLRESAAIHLLILAAAMAMFLAVTRSQGVLVRFLLPPLAILMFTDVAYVAWLNSAYMDNASWVFFLLLASLAACATISRDRGWIASAYAATAVLLVFSKAQHAVLGLPFGALAAWFAWRARSRQWICAAVAIVAAALVMPTLTPPDYTVISLYNLLFYRLAPADHAILGQLNLDPSYEKLAGTTAFEAASPLSDPDWTSAFARRVSFSDVAMLYLRRPPLALHELDRELRDSVHAIRPDYMANYRQSDGFPPHTVATRFSAWSGFRMRFSTDYPYYLPALFCLAILATLLRRSRFLPLALALTVAGACEFAICTLADGVDTHRHLFLFQVITETVILLTFACLLTLGDRLTFFRRWST